MLIFTQLSTGHPFVGLKLKDIFKTEPTYGYYHTSEAFQTSQVNHSRNSGQTVTFSKSFNPSKHSSYPQSDTPKLCCIFLCNKCRDNLTLQTLTPGNMMTNLVQFRKNDITGLSISSWSTEMIKRIRGKQILTLIII